MTEPRKQGSWKSSGFPRNVRAISPHPVSVTGSGKYLRCDSRGVREQPDIHRYDRREATCRYSTSNDRRETTLERSIMLLDQMICLSFCAVILLLGAAVLVKTLHDRKIAKAWYDLYGHDENEDKIIRGEKEPQEEADSADVD